MTKAKKNKKKLTPRRARFVAEFCVDANATQAAIRAGYSPKVADREGYRLLRNAEIRAAIEARQQAREDRIQLNGDRVLNELSRIGDSDLRNYISWGPDGVQMKSSFELTDDQARAVMEVIEVRRTIPQGKGPPIEEIQTRFKLHPKMAALDALAKAHGLFATNAASKHLDALLEVVLLVLRKYVAPERIEHAINDFETLVDSAQIPTAVP